MVRMFANDLRDQGSVPGRFIPKSQKMVLDAFLLDTQHYKILINSMQSNPGKEVVLSPTPLCSSYWKREPSGCPRLWSVNIYIYIYIYTPVTDKHMVARDNK